MFIYRLSKKIYGIVLSGEGAARSGNRWNPRNVPMLYCSESRALAFAEVMVHIQMSMLSQDFQMLQIELLDSSAIEEIDISTLPANWRDFPHHEFTQAVGEQFIRKGEALGLKVPSAVVEGDFNYLLNPYHPEFKLVKVISVSDFLFDRRLIGLAESLNA
jgi:RES domain-containing protein